ncbi:unnamed protein product, partial [Mycena citricolor]
ELHPGNTTEIQHYVLQEIDGKDWAVRIRFATWKSMKLLWLLRGMWLPVTGFLIEHEPALDQISARRTQSAWDHIELPAPETDFRSFHCSTAKTDEVATRAGDRRTMKMHFDLVSFAIDVQLTTVSDYLFLMWIRIL